ncbi:hypothetical protein [Runella zeae]|uniref:hypothetical protein n=1 Tax=Runella zeae TaxID=94255 RepID=UPI00040B8C0B|nr:hypothetical protein [Runella zeae]
MTKIITTYEALSKAPNLIFHAIMESMAHICNAPAGGFETVEQIQDEVKATVRILLSENDLKKQLSVTAPQAHPTTPNRRFVNLIWDNKERITVLAQIMCVSQEGGEV